MISIFACRYGHLLHRRAFGGVAPCHSGTDWWADWSWWCHLTCTPLLVLCRSLTLCRWTFTSLLCHLLQLSGNCLVIGLWAPGGDEQFLHGSKLVCWLRYWYVFAHLYRTSFLSFRSVDPSELSRVVDDDPDDCGSYTPSSALLRISSTFGI